MNFRLIAPAPILSLYIKHYWFLEMEADEGVNELQRVVPNGFIELTFHFADHLRKIKFREELQPGIIISGQKTGFFDVLPTGKTQMLSIQFYPHSAGLFSIYLCTNYPTRHSTCRIFWVLLLVNWKSNFTIYPRLNNVLIISNDFYSAV